MRFFGTGTGQDSKLISSESHEKAIRRVVEANIIAESVTTAQAAIPDIFCLPVLSEKLFELELDIPKNAAGTIPSCADPVSLTVFPPGA
eukprot:s2523_g5.t1